MAIGTSRLRKPIFAGLNLDRSGRDCQGKRHGTNVRPSQTRSLISCIIVHNLIHVFLLSTSWRCAFRLLLRSYCQTCVTKRHEYIYAHDTSLPTCTIHRHLITARPRVATNKSHGHAIGWLGRLCSCNFSSMIITPYHATFNLSLRLRDSKYGDAHGECDTRTA